MDNKVPSIRDLNALGMFAGRISEPQVKSMQSYPFIFFNTVQKVSIDYEIAQTKSVQSYVSYDLTLTEDNDQLPKRFEALQSALRSLFWKELDLKLFINGKEYKNE